MGKKEVGTIALCPIPIAIQTHQALVAIATQTSFVGSCSRWSCYGLPLWCCLLGLWSRSIYRKTVLCSLTKGDSKKGQILGWSRPTLTRQLWMTCKNFSRPRRHTKEVDPGKSLVRILVLPARQIRRKNLPRRN